MKAKLLIFYIVLITLFSCSNNKNEVATIKWIESVEKPIVCKQYERGDLGAKYTLFSADGNVYYTKNIHLALPDTIKLVVK